MNNIHIKINHPDVLVDKLKEVLNPVIIKDEIETVVSFDNHIGKGKFVIISKANEFYNIFFAGIFNVEFSLETPHSKLSANNYVFSISGHLLIKINDKCIETKDSKIKQIVYSQNSKETDCLSWPVETFTTFNLLKVYDDSILGIKAYDDVSKEQSVNNIVSQKFDSSAVFEINNKDHNSIKDIISLTSNKVGAMRKDELIQKVKQIYQFHTKNLTELLQLN